MIADMGTGSLKSRNTQYLTDSVRYSTRQVERLLNETTFTHEKRKALADDVLSLWTAVTLLAMERLSPWGQRRFIKDLPRLCVSKVGNFLVDGIRPLPKPPETDVEVEDERILKQLGRWTHWLTFVVSLPLDRRWRAAAWEDRPGSADDLIALLSLPSTD